jgi:ribosomal protein L11 methyltransferase
MSEAAETLLEALGAVSITLMDAGDTPILEPDPGATPKWQDCWVEALFALPADFEAIRQSVLAASFEPRQVSVDFLEDDDWVNRWRQYAVEFCFAERLWIAPKDAPAPEGSENGLILRLDPGLAFGSGSHPTTRLCLDWLAHQSLAGRRLLDFGCGSGVLALAARLLGCSEVVAVDHDPQALLATTDNAAYNALADQQLTVGDGAVLAGIEPFDVVMANILAAPLQELAPQITSLMKPGASLVMSGILESQVAAVAAAYPGLEVSEVEFEADDQGGRWARLIARKPMDTAV